MERRPRISAWLVALAVAFAAVPAAFTFYPELSDLRLWIRIVIGAVWTAALIATVLVAVRRDGAVEQLVEGTRAERTALVDRTADRVIDAIHDPRHIGIPVKYRVTVFLHDDNIDRLRPIYPNASDVDDDARFFAPGVGIAGQAYQDHTFLVATGRQASDTTYRLTAAQQARHAHLQAVAATPIRVGRHVIGVLTAAADTNDGAFTKRANQEALRSLADGVGTLVELFDLAGG
jgi:transcriptional regulator with GAF, ATPase, and Fis domain